MKKEWSRQRAEEVQNASESGTKWLMGEGQKRAVTWGRVSGDEARKVGRAHGI